MKRIWNWLASMETGIVLLLITALWLTIGSATMRSQPQAFRPLLQTFLEDWLQQHFHNPILWWWMIPLFITVTLLGLSTAACTFDGLYSLATSRQGKAFRYHLGVAAFHGCVLLFLLGHLFMEFSGFRQVVALEEGAPLLIKDAGLSFTLKKAEKVKFTSSPNEPSRLQLTIEVARLLPQSQSVVIQPAVMMPVIAMGWDFHLPMKKQVTKDGKYLLEVRRNPGLLWLAGGCIVLIIGVILAAPRLWKQIFSA